MDQAIKKKMGVSIETKQDTFFGKGLVIVSNENCSRQEFIDFVTKLQQIGNQEDIERELDLERNSEKYDKITVFKADPEEINKFEKDSKGKQK